MADHSKPVLTSTYTNFVSELDARFDDLAVGLDPAVTTATNVPTNAIRWNSALAKWQKWSGAAWGDLSATYNFTAGAFTTLSATGTGSFGGQLAANYSAASAYSSVIAQNSATNGYARFQAVGTLSGVSSEAGLRHAPGVISGIYNTSTDPIVIAPNSTNVVSVSTTGLAVTGALSATTSISAGTTPATTGFVRLPNNGSYAWRNAANTLDHYVYVDPSDVFTVSLNGVVRSTVSSTGLAVTGTQTTTRSGQGVVATFAGGTQAGYIYSGTGIAYFAAEASILNAIGVKEAGEVNIFAAGAQRAIFSSTGLAVTGALSATGNVAAGATLNNWSGFSALQIGARGAVWSSTGAGSTHFSHNAYYNGGFIYMQSAAAASYEQGGGAHYWYTAPSGTAGNAITFTERMTLSTTGLAVTGALSASGNLGVGVASPATRIHAQGLSGVNAEIRATATDTAGNSRATMRLFSSTSTTGGGLVMTNGTDSSYPTSALILYTFDNQPLCFGTNNAERARIDTAGNLGLGVTPSAWGSTYKAIQLGVTGFLLGRTANEVVSLGSNGYVNSGGAWTYQASGNFASLYQQASGSHQWFTAPSGTAGNAITFTQAMTLDASGNLLVGTTSTGLTSGGIVAGPNGGSSYVNIGHASGIASGSAYMNFAYNNVAIGSITQSGTTGISVNSAANLNLTGTSVTAPTPATTDDSTKVATTAYVRDLDIGVDQTWQNVAGSRASGTTYTNSTGKPIMVSVACQATNTIGSVTVGGVALAGFTNSGGTAPNGGSFIVPTGTNYVVTISGGTFSVWAELR